MPHTRPTAFLSYINREGQNSWRFQGENLYDLALRVKIGQNYDPLLLDPTELRFQAKKACCIVRYCEGWSKNSPKERLRT